MADNAEELARNVTKGYQRTLDAESEPFIRQDIIDTIRAAVEQEREACAEIVHDAAMDKRGKTRMAFLGVEREIRARSETDGS